MQGWEAIARLRVSQGLEVETHLGGAYRRSTTDLEFPAVRLRLSGSMKWEHCSASRTTCSVPALSGVRAGSNNLYCSSPGAGCVTLLICPEGCATCAGLCHMAGAECENPLS